MTRRGLIALLLLALSLGAFARGVHAAAMSTAWTGLLCRGGVTATVALDARGDIVSPAPCLDCALIAILPPGAAAAHGPAPDPAAPATFVAGAPLHPCCGQPRGPPV